MQAHLDPVVSGAAESRTGQMPRSPPGAHPCVQGLGAGTSSSQADPAQPARCVQPTQDIQLAAAAEAPAPAPLPAGPVAEALWDWWHTAGAHKDDLKFRRGDQIMVVERPGEQWWSGYLVGSLPPAPSGPATAKIFPANYVRLSQHDV